MTCSSVVTQRNMHKVAASRRCKALLVLVLGAVGTADNIGSLMRSLGCGTHQTSGQQKSAHRPPSHLTAPKSLLASLQSAILALSIDLAISPYCTGGSAASARPDKGSILIVSVCWAIHEAVLLRRLMFRISARANELWKPKPCILLYRLLGSIYCGFDPL